VKEVIESSITYQKVIDNVAVLLVLDPSLKVNVNAYSSPDATNIDRTQLDLTVNNNYQLSQLRAEAGKTYLGNYIKNELGVTNFDNNRISDVNKGISENGAKASGKYIEYEVHY
jgi:hypothetical protein